MTDFRTYYATYAPGPTLAKGIVRIEQFGGLGDWNGSTGTDNLQALTNAIAAATYDARPDVPNRFLCGPTVLFGLGAYYFSGTIDLQKIVTLLGACPPSSNSNGATALIFPTNTVGIQLDESNTTGTTTRTDGPTANGSVIDGFVLRSLGGTDTTKHGIRLRTKAVIRNCSIFSFPGDGIHIRATAGAGGDQEGNANSWYVDNCYVHTPGGNGLLVSGNDANAGTCVKFETAGVTTVGCGVLDQSGLGNNYFGLNIAGYGNTGVSRTGRQYVLIDDTAGIGAATTPGADNTVWYDIGAGGATAQYPAWSGAGTYGLTRPIASFGASNNSIFAGLYVEGAGLSHIQGPAIAFGGQLNFTTYSPALNGSTLRGPMMVNTGIGGVITMHTPTTFADLPGSRGEGMLARITDSTTNTPGAVIAGGGSFHVWAGCDEGTDWRVII